MEGGAGGDGGRLGHATSFGMDGVYLCLFVLCGAFLDAQADAARFLHLPCPLPPQLPQPPLGRLRRRRPLPHRSHQLPRPPLPRLEGPPPPPLTMACPHFLPEYDGDGQAPANVEAC